MDENRKPARADNPADDLVCIPLPAMPDGSQPDATHQQFTKPIRIAGDLYLRLRGLSSRDRIPMNEILDRALREWFGERN